ncbi:hypothetical protein DF186_17460, partial [Enterococcus hirae]
MNDIFTDKHSGYKFVMKMGNHTADYMVNHGIFEWPLIQWCNQFLDKDKVFVDIGAHIGTYSMYLSKFCKQVYSFEA